jgi:glutaminase
VRADDESSFISTGELPDRDRVRKLVDHAHARFASITDGATSDVYPVLQRADPDLFGICIAAVGGDVHEVGDTDVPFPIMSVAKPFAFALLCDRIGGDVARERLGVNATGLPFNSIEAVERSGRTNPMVNPGAIATVSLFAGGADAWHDLRDGLSSFAGRAIDLDEETYASASDTNQRNRALANLLDSKGLIEGDPLVALDLYTRQSCLAVTARDLALMGATLAGGGLHPLTGGRVVSRAACRATLAVMATAGLYETSGEWLYRVGLPGKSGIGGGIVTVSPGKGALATFAPPLDAAGNSVRGQLVAELLSNALGLDLFVSS